MAMINSRIKNKELRIKRGFALLIAVIFMSVMLSFGLTLGSISYKQQVLASDSVESQYAFYAADAALECALHADQGQAQSLFEFPPSEPPSAPVMTCDGASAFFPPSFPNGIISYTTSPAQWVITERLSLDSATAHPRCADVTVYKPAVGSGLTTYIFSQGYDVPCATIEAPGGARFVSRGEDARY